MPVRKAVLHKVLEQHRAAMDLLLRKSFSPRDAARMSTANALGPTPSDTSPVAAGARNA